MGTTTTLRRYDADVCARLLLDPAGTVPQLFDDDADIEDPEHEAWWDEFGDGPDDLDLDKAGGVVSVILHALAPTPELLELPMATDVWSPDPPAWLGDGCVLRSPEQTASVARALQRLHLSDWERGLYEADLSSCAYPRYGPDGESADDTRALLRLLTPFYAEAASRGQGVLIFSS